MSSSAVKTILKKSHHVASAPVAAKKVVPPRFKDLSFSFRAECKAYVDALFAAIKEVDAERSFRRATTSTFSDSPEVEGVLVFRLYDGKMRVFFKSVEAALAVVEELGEDTHVINETLNFTTAYDGEETEDGEQRDTLMKHIEEKLASISFTDVTL